MGHVTVMQAPVDQHNAKPRAKTRKRKKVKVDYYGYDPSILVMEGDPRLEPPPKWFGVNYHPSQPISNSWLEWSGADVAMFDISKNKAIPLPADCSLARDSLKRRRHHGHNVTAPGTVSAPDKKHKKQIGKMTLHPFQPTRNEWTDWNGMDIDESGVDSNAPSSAPSPIDTPTGNSGSAATISRTPPPPTTSSSESQPKNPLPAWGAENLTITKLSRDSTSLGAMSPLKTGAPLEGMMSLESRKDFTPLSLGPMANSEVASHSQGQTSNAQPRQQQQQNHHYHQQQHYHHHQQQQHQSQSQNQSNPQLHQQQQFGTPLTNQSSPGITAAATPMSRSASVATTASSTSSVSQPTPSPLSTTTTTNPAHQTSLDSKNNYAGRIPPIIPVPPPSSRRRPKVDTEDEDLQSSLMEAWDVTELKRSWAMSGENMDQPIEVRNKILAKLNRMRKSMYQFQIEQHRNHLMELMRVLTTRKESYTPHERALIGRALAGDSTDGHALSHEHCEHRHKDEKLRTANSGTPAATDGFDPIKARAKLKVELATKMHVRRMSVFLQQDSKTRIAIADRAFKQILLATKDLMHYTTAALLLQSPPSSSNGSLLNDLQLVPGQLDHLRDALRQEENNLPGVSDPGAEFLRSVALYRIVRILCKQLFLPEAAITNAKITDTLNDKQVQKLLARVASREIFVDSTDPMEDLLEQIRQLSLLAASAAPMEDDQDETKTIGN
mmetsp:Transcript_2076/g.4737  ORF Transcript_2076/g.4737 Transcript_2076/m.4737 type:complete len:723 (-) Transcript_2076:622-2790(-)